MSNTLDGRALAYFGAGVVTAGLCTGLYQFLDSWGTRKTHASPVETHLPHLTREEIEKLPYPPNLIPGARDVPTPYGTIRVYEWGPEDAARKVMLIHGISGGCPALLSCAEAFASKGCRIMMIELFGRGWSGGPSDLPYDGRLYCTQLLLSLASSPISWTGENRFSLVGYSLGGCIATAFASYFPRLVQDLVLVAPAGLIRDSDPKSWLVYSGMLPNSVTASLAASRIRRSPSMVAKPQLEEVTSSIEEATSNAMPKQKVAVRGAKLNSQAIVKWQIKNNEGFMKAFVGSIKDGPTRGQHERWRVIGERCNQWRKNRGAYADTKLDQSPKDYLESGQILLVVGGRDMLIKAKELVPDAEKVVGKANIEVKTFPISGHEVGMSKGPEIAAYALDFWHRRAE